jgi:phosphoenolpyruvate-protein kinase (PTS system EI component)
VLCAERGSPSLAAFADSLHPAVVRVCQQVIEKCHQAGIKASVCGEVASDSDAIPILLGLGLREFSVVAAAIPGTKALIRTLDAEAITARLGPKIPSFSAASDVRNFSKSLRESAQR